MQNIEKQTKPPLQRTVPIKDNDLNRRDLIIASRVLLHLLQTRGSHGLVLSTEDDPESSVFLWDFLKDYAVSSIKADDFQSLTLRNSHEGESRIRFMKCDPADVESLELSLKNFRFSLIVIPEADKIPESFLRIISITMRMVHLAYNEHEMILGYPVN